MIMNPLLKLQDVAVQIKQTPILTGINLQLMPGEILGLVGPNGAGKTTLLHAIAGLQAYQGNITLAGYDLSALTPPSRSRYLAYLTQGHISHWAMSVEDLVMLGRLPHLDPWQNPTEKDHQIVKRVLQICDGWQFKDRPVTQLSGGERARIMLARALAVEAPLLLADEPTASLDPAHQLDVMHCLLTLAREGSSVIVVLHDLTLASRFCHRLALLAQHTIVATGQPTEVLSPDNLARYYSIRAFYGTAQQQSIIVPLEKLSISPESLHDPFSYTIPLDS